MGFMVERPEGSHRWVLRVSTGRDPLTGQYREVSRTYRGNKRGAQQALAELTAKLGRGHGQPPRDGTDATLAHLLDTYLEHIADDLSPSTLAGYRRRVAKRIRPALGTIPLRKLTAHDLDVYYRALQRRGRRPSDIRQDHAIIRGALRRALDWGWIAENVATRARPPSITQGDIDPPDPAAVVALLTAAYERDTRLGVYLRLAAATGARRGELCGLRWSDVDDHGVTVTIRRNVVDGAGRLHIKDTKTHAARRVTLDAATRDLLADHLLSVHKVAAAADVELAADGYVFARSIDGREPWSPQAVSQAFAKVRRQVGFTGRLHDLRHFHATRLLDAGIPVKQVAGRLGHSKASTTLNVYAAFLDPADAASAAAIGRLLDR